MLVLTRRENEKILLPDVGVTVEVMSVSGDRARLGITAPSDIRILREEVAAEKDTPPPFTKRGAVPRELIHALRNRLNTALLAAEMIRLQIENGVIGESAEPVERIIAELNELAKIVLAERSPSSPKPVQADHRPWRALLVEDNINERKLLASYLRMTGFEVDTAGDGADALDYLHSHARPDVVLLDMMMPRCDGATALNRIRRDPKLEGMKVYAVSGTSPKGYGLTTGPGGVDRWFEKPVDPRDLVRQLNTELIANEAS